MTRIDWGRVLERAAAIVRGYDTSVTLRQLFYRLVSEQALPNSNSAYKRLSTVTAEARRGGDFPDLIDRGRSIHRYTYFDGPVDALSPAARESVTFPGLTGNPDPRPGRLLVADLRRGRFIERHGALMQVELDALDPTTLQSLFADAVAEHWDTAAYETALAQERDDLRRLDEAAGGLS